MTDEELTQKMQEKGFTLSRRTVSKYHESLGIPVGRLRREL
jgi:RNA polymerase sigma-54 factor